MEEKNELRKKGKNFMSRNVTEFRHFISNGKNGSVTENDLNWVMGLRQNNPVPPLQKGDSSPPEVYFKTTATTKIKQEQRYKKYNSSIIPNEYDHIYLKNTDNDKNHHQTQSQVIFYSSLRKDNSSVNNRSPQKNFSTIPFKERTSEPRFIKKEFAKKIKNIQEQDLESGLDGAHKQNPYTQNILKVKNHAVLSQFTKVRGRNQVSLPSLAWQMGLRSYR